MKHMIWFIQSIQWVVRLCLATPVSSAQTCNFVQSTQLFSKSDQSNDAVFGQIWKVMQNLQGGLEGLFS